MPMNGPEYERGFTDGFNAGANGVKATSDAEQLAELRQALDHALSTKHDIRTCACGPCSSARQLRLKQRLQTVKETQGK